MQDLIQDFRYAIRQLIKAPAFTLICLATLMLGVGANTAIFSVMNTVLLRYLPVPNPQQLVYLHLRSQPLGTSQTGYNDTSLSLPFYEAMRAQRQVFSRCDRVCSAGLGKTRRPVRPGSRKSQRRVGEREFLFRTRHEAIPGARIQFE